LAIVGSLLVVGVMLTVSTGAAHAAGVPKGNGLETFGPINCPDFGGDIFATGGRGENAPAWLDDGTMLVVKSLSGTFTVTDSGTVVDSGTFSQSFGNKTGLGATTQCTAHFEETEGDITFTADIVVDVVIVPRG
jgi:hypothetical protein